MAEITEVSSSGKRKSPLRELIETAVVALAIALLIRGYVVEVYRVAGSSMLNTLRNGERVLVNKFVYRFRRPHPGDIIVFQYPRQPDRDFIKRVVATAGDKVEIKEGKVYVNGQLFPEAPTVRLSEADVSEKIVPENSVWVLGDNRNNSEDSRYFGEVPLGNIRGFAFFRVWPLNQIGNLDRAAEEAGR